MSFDYAGRHVVVTGGTGALGRAVVEAFVAAGAVCHVPHRGAVPADLVPSERVRLTSGVELADEAHVMRFYSELPALWASVHVAGGFAAAPATATTLAALRAQPDPELSSERVPCARARRRGTSAPPARAGATSTWPRAPPSSRARARSPTRSRRRGWSLLRALWPKRSRTRACSSTPCCPRRSTPPPTARRCPALRGGRRALVQARRHRERHSLARERRQRGHDRRRHPRVADPTRQPILEHSRAFDSDRVRADADTPETAPKTTADNKKHLNTIGRQLPAYSGRQYSFRHWSSETY